MDSSSRLTIAIEAIKKGEMIILIDSEDRENEGDLVLAAQFSTAEKINFFIRQACGLVCLALESQKVDELGLPLMAQENQSPRQTAFTVSIEAAVGVGTGISAQDRAHTILVASKPGSTRKDLVTPGHIFPLRAAPGGVLQRAGHTEGSIEICKMAGLLPAAVICEIINEDGTMARKPDLEKFSAKFNIPIVTIEELIAARTQTENWLIPSEKADFPSSYHQDSKSLTIQSFKNEFTDVDHAVVATKAFGKTPLVRIHSECLTGDALGSLRCDCGEQLKLSLQKISTHEHGGALIYLKNHEGRGIGLWNKIQAYALQDKGKDTVDANLELGFHPDARHYHEAAKILMNLGLTHIQLLTNNPLKVNELKTFGIHVQEVVSLEVAPSAQNKRYLDTKRDRFHHHLNPTKGTTHGKPV